MIWIRLHGGLDYNFLFKIYLFIIKGGRDGGRKRKNLIQTPD